MASSLTPDFADAVRAAEILALIRIGLGVMAWVAPALITEPWVGPTGEADARAVLSRALGARDISLGLGALLAARNHRGLRGWVEAGGLADAGDLVATLIGFRRLPRFSRWGLVAMTAAAVVAAGVLAPSLTEG
jgi:hypothetical protein